MIRTVIVEDETLAAERLWELLTEAEPEIQVVARFDSVRDTVDFFRNGGKADLLMLDIELADGKSFGIFDHITINIPIIFTTAYDQYALMAFKTYSIDYLLKPVQLEDLKRSLEKFKSLKGGTKGIGPEEIAELRNLILDSKSGYKERILIKSGTKLQYKPLASAAYFYSEGKGTYMVEKGENSRQLIDHTLEELEGMIDPKMFFRISRKFIVNINSIQELRGQISTGMEVKLNQPCEHQLSVSRERTNDLKDWMDR